MSEQAGAELVLNRQCFFRNSCQQMCVWFAFAYLKVPTMLYVPTILYVKCSNYVIIGDFTNSSNYLNRLKKHKRVQGASVKFCPTATLGHSMVLIPKMLTSLKGHYENTTMNIARIPNIIEKFGPKQNRHHPPLQTFFYQFEDIYIKLKVSI